MTTTKFLLFSGSWVWGKLLGIQNMDIGVGIENVSGCNFASPLREYVSGNMEKCGFGPLSVNKAESNPEKSRHRGTATRKLPGLDIDFCNLRSETYSEVQ